MGMRRALRSGIGLAFLGLVAGQTLAAEQPVNLARGKTYTMSTPNYALCADPEDGIQLTDGVRTQGHFWTRKTTVGWSGGGTVSIVIDLAADSPIGALALSTAGGVADVHWPAGITVLLSPDGKTWHEIGDLASRSARSDPPPAYGTYATYTYRRDGLATHGRFVRFLVEPEGTYVFCDEIEVYAGTPEALAAPYAGEALPDSKDLGRLLTFNRLLKAQLARDLQAAQDCLHVAPLTAEQKHALEQQAEALAARLAGLPRQSPAGFRAVLPMNDLERDVFAFQAAVWRAEGKAALRVWQTQRWDPLAPSQEPTPGSPPAALSIAMMQNEVRADVLNLTNAAATATAVRIETEQLPGDPAVWLTVYEVQNVGTRCGVAVAAALTGTRRAGKGWEVSVPAGMTRQVWVSAHSAALPAGVHEGVLRLRTAGSALPAVPFRLRVFPLHFPDQTTLNLGGWEYTDRSGVGGITAANREALVTHLRERYVNAPWASAAALPLGTYDAQGNFARTPDTTVFDAFVKLWPGARHYMVFLGIGDWGNLTAGFAGSARGTPLFETKLSTWARFWADHVRTLGLKPEQLGLLIVDEPHNQVMYDAILAYSRVIQQAAPELTLWIDPQPDADLPVREMLRSMDVLVPHRPQWLQSKEWFPALFASLRQEGKQIGLYSADGPARTFDPYAYYLLQEWHCFSVGGNWAGFWSFGGDSSFSVWNEYAADGRGSYCPMYLDDQGVTAGKWMEAVREGVQDYEYLVMLRQAVQTTQAASPARRAAETLLAQACERVLAGTQGGSYRWDSPRDRSVVDTVRLEILEALAALQER